MSVPIVLTYHGSGIKVDQLSSSVGLGWGLNAGGAIQRNIRIKPDGEDVTSTFTQHVVDSITSNLTVYSADYMNDVQIDFSQDDYTYNFSGFGGSFFFDSTRALRQVIKDAVKIEHAYASGYHIFSAKDYFGNTYFFDSTDESHKTSWASNSTMALNPPGGVTSWRLTKVSNQGLDSILIDYEKYHVNYQYTTTDVYDYRDLVPSSCAPPTEENGWGSCNQEYPTTMYQHIAYFDFDNSLVKQIRSRDTKVDFYYSDDTAAAIWERRLDSIIVTSLVDSLVKRKIHLKYSLFEGKDQLKLLAVHNIDIKTGEREETKFEYYEDANFPLPEIGSRSKDMFDYFNGKTNQFLICTDEPEYTYTDADRTINPNTIKLGSLQKVIYPTGGFTELIYEPNKDTGNIYGPGMRVKEIIEYNAINNKLKRTAYEFYRLKGVKLPVPFNMLPQEQTAGTHRKIFSSDLNYGPYNNFVKSFSSLIAQGYAYDSVVLNVKGADHDLKSSYLYDNILVHDGLKSLPVESKEYQYDTLTSTYGVVRKAITSFGHIIQYEHATPLVEPSPFFRECYLFASCRMQRDLQYQYMVPHIILKGNEYVTTYAGSDSITEETRYYYDNLDHGQVSRVVRMNSIDSTITLIKYPAEMVSGSLDPSGVYQQMLNKYMWGQKVIEETTNAASSSLAKSTTDYSAVSNGGGGITFIAADSFRIALKGNTPELRRHVLSYDTYGNITEYEEDSLRSCIVWDYNGTVPVAKVVNAALTKVHYTSFETNYTGGWILSGGSYSNNFITGKRAYTLSSGNSISTLTSGLRVPTGNLVVSYWSRNGSMSINSTTGTAGFSKNGWTYYEHSISSTTGITITGTGTIDELRMYPKEAQMSTYAYESLVGMSASCDINNRILYYEYDGSGRLYVIRDIDSNVLKKYNYEVRHRGAGAMYYNEEISEHILRDNCGSGYEGSYYTYRVKAGRYSSNISQADADNKAYLEIRHLGQAYANLYGKCNIICVPACPSPQKKCIDGVCVKGILVYTSSEYNLVTGKYDCMGHYEYSDGSWSLPFLTESDTPCL